MTLCIYKLHANIHTIRHTLLLFIKRNLRIHKKIIITDIHKKKTVINHFAHDIRTYSTPDHSIKYTHKAKGKKKNLIYCKREWNEMMD